MELRQDPASKKVYLDARSCLYDFDGTPYRRPDEVGDWATLSRASVPCLYDWQEDPGRYGFAAYLVTRPRRRGRLCRNKANRPLRRSQRRQGAPAGHRRVVAPLQETKQC